MRDTIEIGDLVGRTIVATRASDDEFNMAFSDGIVVTLYHWQGCCESVWLDDVAGDLSDLVGHPLIKAEETTSDSGEVSADEWLDDSATWTFYHFRTVKGSVTLRWVGTSTGNYSESVDIKAAQRADGDTLDAMRQIRDGESTWLTWDVVELMRYRGLAHGSGPALALTAAGMVEMDRLLESVA